MTGEWSLNLNDNEEEDALYKMGSLSPVVYQLFPLTIPSENVELTLYGTFIYVRDVDTYGVQSIIVE